MNQDLIRDLEEKLLKAISEVGAKVDVLNSQIHGDGVNSGVASRLRELEKKYERLDKIRELETKVAYLMKFKAEHEEFTKKLWLKIIGGATAGAGATAGIIQFL